MNATAHERLDRRLERGAVEVDEVVAIARMLADHLDALHRDGKVDGAVVPARIELTPGNAPRLVEATEEHRGHKAYVAPEAWGDGTTTPAADQFSMAAILYEALCGGRAFPGDDSVKIRISITTGSRVPLAARVPGLADAVDEVFARALSLEPERRYSSCAAFADALIEAVQGTRPSRILVEKPTSRTSTRRSQPPPMPDWGDQDEPISWTKIAVGLALLAALAAILAVATK